LFCDAWCWLGDVKVQGLMEAGRSETKKVRRNDSDNDKCQAESGLGWRPISETGDQRSENRGRNDMVVTLSL
jgi:hypothetical protein